LVLDPELRLTLMGQVNESALAPRAAAAWLAHQLATESGGGIPVSELDQPFIVFGATLGH
jgi:histidine phosphotransferase ChpT